MNREDRIHQAKIVALLHEQLGAEVVEVRDPVFGDKLLADWRGRVSARAGLKYKKNGKRRQAETLEGL